MLKICSLIPFALVLALAHGEQGFQDSPQQLDEVVLHPPAEELRLQALEKLEAEAERTNPGDSTQVGLLDSDDGVRVDRPGSRRETEGRTGSCR